MPHPRCHSAQESSFSLHKSLQTKNLPLQYLLVVEDQQILNHSEDLWANNCYRYAVVASGGAVAAAAEDVVAAAVVVAPAVVAPAAASVAGAAAFGFAVASAGHEHVAVAAAAMMTAALGL
jgi:hypothetical protein